MPVILSLASRLTVLASGDLNRYGLKEACYSLSHLFSQYSLQSFSNFLRGLWHQHKKVNNIARRIKKKWYTVDGRKYLKTEAEYAHMMELRKERTERKQRKADKAHKEFMETYADKISEDWFEYFKIHGDLPPELLGSDTN